MNISFDVNLPPDVEERLRAEAPGLSAAGREAFAVDLLRRGILTHHGLGQTLGLNRFETDALLKRHRVTEQSLSHEDVQSLNAFFGEAGWLGRAGGNDPCHRPVPLFQTGSQIAGRPSMGARLSHGLGSANLNLPTFCLLISQRFDEEGAIHNFERAVKLDPRDVRPLMERGKLEVGRGRLESGLTFFDQAMSIDAGEPEVHYQRSLVLTRLGRTALAKAEQDTSARLRAKREHIQKLLNEMLGAPGDLDHQYDAACWLFEHGHPEEGLRWTEKILREQPRHAKTNRLLADYYEKKGSHGLANFCQLQAKSEP